jgi:hypothetical protein
MAFSASPCESSRWCEARRAVGQWRLDPERVPEEGDDPRLVVGDELRHRRAEAVGDDRRVLGEPLCGVALAPAAGILQRLRQVPVVERGDRLDAAIEQALGEPPVERQPLGVRRPAAVWLDARPGDREAVALQPELGHQVEVLLEAVVVVARDVAGVAVDDRARHAAEAVPDRLAAAAVVDRALDLVGGRGGAEAQRRREGARVRLDAGLEDLWLDGRHPLTAPAVMPRTSQRWAAKNATTTGSVEMTPAAISWP